MKVIVTGGVEPPGKSRSAMQVMAMKSAGKMWPIIKPMTLGVINHHKAGHIGREVAAAMKGRMDVRGVDSFDGADIIFAVYPTPQELIKEALATGIRMIQI